jgi:hypothetical protein
LQREFSKLNWINFSILIIKIIIFSSQSLAYLFLICVPNSAFWMFFQTNHLR